MSKTAVFIYKCRLCGEVFHGAAECNEDKAEDALVISVLTLHKITPELANLSVPRIVTHECNAGTYIKQRGVADLVGYRVKELRKWTAEDSSKD